jgi:hypothetical protein
MATHKRPNVAADVASRHLAPVLAPVDTREPQGGHNVATRGLQRGYNRATLKPVHIRLVESDYEALEIMAENNGTTKAALIRQAIKDLLKRGKL